MADTSNHQSVRGIATTTSDPRRGEQRALAARGAMGALILGVLAVVLQSAATATPMWGYFTNPDENLMRLNKIQTYDTRSQEIMKIRSKEVYG
ncbi:hypothetical protein PV326_006872 [Microctonus aethiopoides]|nr:hypothetical protein PV326_006872 [Microctonus aethiopoides]